MLSNLEHICIEQHATARNKAVAKHLISSGATIVTAMPLATALLTSEKGQRCDYCHRFSSKSSPLMKCTGCTEYWYCGPKCQTAQWKAHHRKICKQYNRYVASAEFQALPLEERVDAILLSQMLASTFQDNTLDIAGASRSSNIAALFFELLVGPTASRRTPPICQSKSFSIGSTEMVDKVYSRFGNNNFVIHSHLTSYAHGIYPLASRLFNHSCIPNSAAKYIINPEEPVKMEIVALRDITEGEEITVPYLDPALPFDIRQEALRANYGFECTCELCAEQRKLQPIPLPSEEMEVLRSIEKDLCAFSIDNILQRSGSQLPVDAKANLLRRLPKHLLPLLHADYLPKLSETFSRCSHEGEYDLALSSGRTLLALYAIIYPEKYPQIGMHALELTKTAWNAIVIMDDSVSTHLPLSKQLWSDARLYLSIASAVLDNFGPEGDKGGPQEELRIMHELLNNPSAV